MVPVAQKQAFSATGTHARPVRCARQSHTRDARGAFDWRATLQAASGAGRGADRLAVGLGMVPRGEVGLVFAAIGKSLDVITDDLFSAIVLMVIITTLISPQLLKLALRSGEQRKAESDAQETEVVRVDLSRVGL